jgi:alkylation response protein AidB-like acyl-CoA dehydrogenase
MDLGFKPFQETLRKTARAYLRDACSLAKLRAAEDSVEGFAPEAYREMAGLGWFGLGLPAAEGGKADDLINHVVLYEEFGYAALPGPHFVSSALGSHLLLRLGNATQQGLRDDIVRGERIVSVALYEQSAGYDPDAVELRAERRNGHFTLDGRKLFVPFAHLADPLLVLARTGQRSRDLSFFALPAGTPGVELRPLETLSGEKQFEVRFDGAELPQEALLGPMHGGWAGLQATLPVATVLQCAELVGIADAALEIAVDYAKQRIAFGRPIGSFQAIQHKCADMLADRDAARYLTYQAACLVNMGGAARAEVAMAGAFAPAAARRVTKEAHQILAGVGYTLDHRLNFYYRRAKAIELALGDVDEQLITVAERLGLC